MKRPPAEPEHANSWYERLRQWWDSLHPVLRSLHRGSG